MKFKRESSMRLWAVGPVICVSGLLLGLGVDASPLLLAACLLFLLFSLLAVEWVVLPAERMILKRVTIAFSVAIFRKRYYITDRHHLLLSITSKGTQTRHGDFISDYAELALAGGNDTLFLTAGTDVERVASIADSISTALSIKTIRKQNGA